MNGIRKGTLLFLAVVLGISFIPAFSVPDSQLESANIQVSLASTLALEGEDSIIFKVGEDAYHNISSLVSGGTPPYAWNLVGGHQNLTDFGLALSNTGVIRGKPEKEGSFQFRALVDDSSSPRQSAQADFSGRVVKAAPKSGDDSRTGPKYTGGGLDLTIQGLEKLLGGLVCWINRIAFLLIVIFVVWTGVKYVALSGNPTKVSSVHTSFKYVVIGAAVILGVGLIIATIANIVGIDINSLTPLCIISD